MDGSPRPLRVGNGAGFWGDNLDAPFRLARDGRLDVLTLEYLAELTLAILAHQRTRDPDAGFVNDFPDLLERLIPILKDGGGPSIVTNAGGLNPIASARRCGAILSAAGIGDRPIGVVGGDDVLGRIPGWIADGVDLTHLETGAPMAGIADRLVSANVYLGARPIAEAIAGGASLVITGRVADASLTLGPVAAHFGWSWTDWDRLAGASAAGHVIECGAQATGGLWHAWADVPDLAGIGYPIAEVDTQGSSVISRPDGSGGVVSIGTIAEQLVYEIDDPTRYRTPDVDVDLTSLRLAQRGADRVEIRGARGQMPGGSLKLAAVYRDGWTASGLLAVAGRDASVKARAAGRIVLDRVRLAGFELADTLVEVLGAGDLVPGVVRVGPSFEVVLRVTVRDPRKAAVERFCREMAPLVTSGPPGIAGYATGRPSPRPAFGYWPALVPRALVEAEVRVGAASDWAGDRVPDVSCSLPSSLFPLASPLVGEGRVGGDVASSSGPDSKATPLPNPPPQVAREPEMEGQEFSRGPFPLRREGRAVRGMSSRSAGDPPPAIRTMRLAELAHARSGDKGNTSNIGVVADDPRSYAWIVEHLTAKSVADHFQTMGIGAVRRYTLPNLLALNFVIDAALAGGASRSLRLDSQGKALGMALLEIELPAPDFLEVGS